MICLNKKQIEELKPRLKALGGEGITKMTSKERETFFTEALGNKEMGTFVTASFEKAMVSKQKSALKRWAKNVFTEKEQKTPNYFSVIKKIDNLTERGVLSSNNVGNYLDTLISTQLGVDITDTEVKKINELSDSIKTSKVDLENSPNNEKARVAYGRSIIEMYDYVQTIAPIKDSMFNNIANLPKSLMSTMDFSAPFRQGFGMVSRPEFWKSFSTMFKVAFSEDAYRNLKADIISRPNYNLMKKSGLRISVLAEKLSQREEQFMSTLLDKLPIPEKVNIVKNVLQGSERAYSGFLSKLRADVFDHLVETAKLAGENVEIDSSAARDIANVVNDFTGSGNIGKNDRMGMSVPILNATFFSPRKISATVNMFNPERYVNPSISPTARKAALRQLIGSLAFSAALIALRSLFAGDDDKAEVDSRSANFGKLKFGDTRIDVTGGNSVYLTLLSRLFQNSSKSSITGKITEFDQGYKPSTRLSTLMNFVKNKLSPIASFFVDAFAGTDSVGNKFEIKKEILSRFVPLIISTIISTAKDDPSHVVIATLSDLFGFGANTYSDPNPPIKGIIVDGLPLIPKSTGIKEVSAAKKIMTPYEYGEFNQKVVDALRVEYTKLLENNNFMESTDKQKKETLKNIKKEVMSTIMQNEPYENRIQQEIETEKLKKKN